MKNRINCWEFKKCGRQPGGEKTKSLGLCKASLEESAHGINGGKNGGRICWAVAGTLCGGIVQGTYAEKYVSCMACEFYNLVKNEEDFMNFDILMPGQKYIPQPK